MRVHDFNSSTREAEAGGWISEFEVSMVSELVLGQTGLHREHPVLKIHIHIAKKTVYFKIRSDFLPS